MPIKHSSACELSLTGEYVYIYIEREREREREQWVLL
jgi:hypothetical protein